MRTVLLFLIAIVPNVSSSTTKSQEYIYERGNDKKGCAKGTRVTTLDECKVASTFLKTKRGSTPVVKIKLSRDGKAVPNAPSGCYFYVDGDELHFNDHKDLRVFTDGDEPICKVSGTTTTEKTTTTTISKRINDACTNQDWQGDGNCDAGNNNAGCNWDKLNRRGGSVDSSETISDCCKGPTAMKNCKDPDLCKCKDPDFQGEVPTEPKKTTTTPAPTEKTSTPTPTPAPATKTTTPAPTKKVTSSAETKVTKKTSGPAKKTEAASLTTKVVKEVVKDASSHLPSTLWAAIICCALIFAAC